MKKILCTFIIIILIIFLINLCQSSNVNNVSEAADGNGTSDIQLIARAINRRSKRRKLRGTGGSRSSYFK